MTNPIGSSFNVDLANLPSHVQNNLLNEIGADPRAANDLPNLAPNTPETRFPSGFDTHAPQIAFAQPGYDAAFGQSIASDAASEARRRGTTGNCYNAVADVIDRKAGKFLTGMHAYMAADQLAARKQDFREVPPNDLGNLPAGAVVVWGTGNSRSGHISIALGDGREASDHIAPQMKSHYGGAPARVFIPIR